MEPQIESVASSTGVSISSGMGVKNRAEYVRLKATPAGDFDKAYITEMIKDHQEDIAAFQNEANSGTNSDIQALASKALPTLQEYLRLAEKTARDIGVSPTGSGAQ
jgi:putative membrane protein